LAQTQLSVLNELEKTNTRYEEENKNLVEEKDDLQGKIRQSKKENQDKKTKNRKLEAEIKQQNLKMQVMEDNIEKIIQDNGAQFV
jgi:hypothetical protein